MVETNYYNHDSLLAWTNSQWTMTGTTLYGRN